MAMFLIACFALTLFVYQRYALALRVSGEAREALWARVSPGCADGELDGRLAGGYPAYRGRQQRLVPRLSDLHDSARVERQRERRDARFYASTYLGGREVRYATSSSTLCNETADFPEDELPYATIDTWCRVSDECRPEDVPRLLGAVP